MPASLFVCPTLGLTADAEPEIVTPLGTLTLDAEFDGILIGDLKPSATYQLERGGHLFSWTLDGFTAELLLCRPQFSLPAGMAVDDCWAGMWRLRTSVSGERPEFSCIWVHGSHRAAVGPDSGEGLDAQSWEDGPTRVTIGTVDAELMARYASDGLLPPRWADLLGWSFGSTMPDPGTGKIDPVVYQENGFRIILPILEAGEKCQVQFVVAWSSRSDEIAEAWANDRSTWRAVDRRPDDMMTSAGCV